MQKVPDLYKQLDAELIQLHQIHSNRLKCGLGCSACCVDDITVFEVEADNIRNNYKDLLEHGLPHPKGACAFLSQDNSCRIYEHRPYVCRSQGLPLRWLEDQNQEVVELRDICPLNDEGRPIEELPEEECWTIGPFEEKLLRLQLKEYENRTTRIALRELFNNNSILPY
ncbi:MAG: YkgJ family cysteine cluster protein [Blastocatellia bacterium]|nr:YkgJ family cysteine cluster protein [Blastocatellia bacterium]